MSEVVVITGASRGIGAAVARLAAASTHMLLWLLSAEASFATGAFIDVTGGCSGEPD